MGQQDGVKGACCQTLPPEFNPQDLPIILWPSYTQSGTCVPPSYTHTKLIYFLKEIHGAGGMAQWQSTCWASMEPWVLSPATERREEGWGGRRKEWKRNMHERNLELCKWPSHLAYSSHGRSHTLNAVLCIYHILPRLTTCHFHLFLLTRMVLLPAFRSSGQALRNEMLGHVEMLCLTLRKHHVFAAEAKTILPSQQ